MTNPRKRYHYPAGMQCEYPHQLPKPNNIHSAQTWVVSLQRDLQALHGLLENLLAPQPTTEDFTAARKMINFAMAKEDAVMRMLPKLHARIAEHNGTTPKRGLATPLPIAAPVDEPMEEFNGIEFVPSATKETNPNTKEPKT